MNLVIVITSGGNLSLMMSVAKQKICHERALRISAEQKRKNLLKRVLWFTPSSHTRAEISHGIRTESN
jgi:hypothetical protein